MTISNYAIAKTAIKFWAEEDRPREKLMLKGKQSLTNSELLAILLGSGNREESALGLAQRVLHSVDNKLVELSKCGLEDLMQFKGIGEAKAINVTAAMELGRRRQIALVSERPRIKVSKDAFKLLGPRLVDLRHEEFWILLLNRSNYVIGTECVSSGGVAGTVVDAKIIFKKAVLALASSIILCHNHPSGGLQPSQADLDITQKLKKGGKSLDIMILDHLIVSERGFYSFADEGKL